MTLEYVDGGMLDVLDGRPAAAPGAPRVIDAEVALIGCAHGVAVPPGLPTGLAVDAHGAAVLPSMLPAAGADARGAFMEDWLMPLALGCARACGDTAGAAAEASRSQRNRLPKGKCCTTGNLESTSALYILIIPCLGSVPVQHGMIVTTYLVDLGPSIFDPRDVIQCRAVFPERSLFDVEDETNRRKV